MTLKGIAGQLSRYDLLPFVAYFPNKNLFPELHELNVFIIFLPGEHYDFAINNSTGLISTTACIDREYPTYVDGTITLNVLAMNSKSATTNLNDTTSVIISIEDINDNPPIFDPKEYEETLGILLPYIDLLTVIAYDMDEVILLLCPDVVFPFVFFLFQYFFSFSIASRLIGKLNCLHSHK